MIRIWYVLSLALLLVNAVNIAEAEVISIDVTIQSIDVKNQKIIIDRKGKTTEFDVSKNAGISSLKIGQKVTLSYHLELETVLKIEPEKKAGLQPPKVVALHELNINPPNFAPWISKDGLSIYWTRDESIWWAQRKSVNESFRKQSRLFDGFMPTVSGDGLYMVLCRPLKMEKKDLGRRLFYSTRVNEKSGFSPPKEIRELRDMGILMAPCISSDGLKLYMTCHGPAKNQRGHWVVTRDDRSSRWDVTKKHRILPHPYPIPTTTPFVTPDHGSVLLTNRTNTTNGAFGGLLMLSKDPVKVDVFSIIQKQIELDGELIIGRFPRYCPVARQLFYSAPVSNDRQSEGIWCIKDYDISN